MSKLKQEAGNMMQRSVFGLANVLALASAMFGTGPLYSATQSWVYEFAASHYGYSAADFITLVWGALCAAFIFFGARMSIAAAIMFGVVTFIARFAV